MLELPASLLVSDTESVLDSLRVLQREVAGDPQVCVAVLDGPVDLSHPCFRGANLTRVDTLVEDPGGAGEMSTHGTHVASVIFGQPSTGTLGIAARCRGLFLPVFRDSRGYLSQLDLARVIERAVLEGANIINVSGGERAPRGEPDPILARALNLCDQSNVLLVAAAGNDGCDCVHVPAAVAPALAVGAMDRANAPVESSNFGEEYRTNGILAPGEAIPGAVPGGGIAQLTGSSFATPIVSGLAALLMSFQRRDTGEVDARAIRGAILDSAIPCEPPDLAECARYLAGTLNVPGAYALTKRGGRPTVPEFDAGPNPQASRDPAAAVPLGAGIDTGAGITPSAAPPEGDAGQPPMGATASPPAGVPGAAPGAVASTADAPGSAPTSGPAALAAEGQQAVAASQARAEGAPAPFAEGQQDAMGPGGVNQSCNCGGTVPSAAGTLPAATNGAVAAAMPVPAPVAVAPVAVSNVFVIGTIDRDFGTQARLDTFRQLMPRVTSPGSPPVSMAPNPYDTTQLADYLDANPWESTKVIWTLNLELTPIYAIEAEVTYAEHVYSLLRQALRNQALPADDANYVSRVSIPAVLTTRTVRLYSGQIIPVVVAQPRGLYIWNEAALVDAVVAAVHPEDVGADVDRVRLQVRQMLDKVYYQLRNLGQSPPDRAVNFQATNAFVFTEAIARGLLSGNLVETDSKTLYTIDAISAVKSPYCRVDSDCWDVQISFFNPENDNQARVVFQSTIDVSDELPVQLAPTRQFLFAG